ncbi:hypothetical protein Pcinc_031563 [Petrolisthes cinctipes]|uniref:Uncharacterized protein n=1 Tax=Petrolisthes cinctipes TaxID=88211 RepID=A0AAE1EWF1_PETCI|nr:hypothetical protein Pcinc_031563 [Petrolisthes cinctipes]
MSQRGGTKGSVIGKVKMNIKKSKEEEGELTKQTEKDETKGIGKKMSMMTNRRKSKEEEGWTTKQRRTKVRKRRTRVRKRRTRVRKRRTKVRKRGRKRTRRTRVKE